MCSSTQDQLLITQQDWNFKMPKPTKISMLASKLYNEVYDLKEENKKLKEQLEIKERIVISAFIQGFYNQNKIKDFQEYTERFTGVWEEDNGKG